MSLAEAGVWFLLSLLVVNGFTCAVAFHRWAAHTYWPTVATKRAEAQRQMLYDRQARLMRLAFEAREGGRSW